MPKGPAVWPLPAATSIVMMVSRIFSAVLSRASMCSSVSVIYIIVSDAVRGLERLELRDLGRRVVCPQNAGTDDQIRDVKRDELLRIGKRNAAVHLHGNLRVPTTEYPHLLEDSFVEGLSLPPDA